MNINNKNKQNIIVIVFFIVIGFLIFFSIDQKKTNSMDNPEEILVETSGKLDVNNQKILGAGSGEFSCYSDVDPLAGLKKTDTPDAIYYDEPKEIELTTCEKTEENFAGSFEGITHQLFRKCNSDRNYQGFVMVTAEVLNFPQLEHFGSTEPVVTTGDNIENTNLFGTMLTPYEPLCSTIARITGNENLNMAQEFRGKLKFYTEDGDDLYYSMPKLGSGVSCLNLISMLDNSNLAYANIEEDYEGFHYFGLSQGAKDETDENARESVEVGTGSTSNEVLKSFKGWVEVTKAKITKKLSDWKSIGKNFQGDDIDYERDYLVAEPVFEYEDIPYDDAYCRIGNENVDSSYSGLEVRHINLSASEDTEAEYGMEQIIYLKTINVDIEKLCETGSPNVLVDNSYDGRSYFCYQEYVQKEDEDGNISYEVEWKMKNPLPKQTIPGFESGDFTTMTITQNYDLTPTKIAVPGAMSGFGRFYQYLQLKAGNQQLIGPLNGTKLKVITRYYDPLADGPVNTDNLEEHSELDPTQGDVPFQNEAVPYFKGKYEVEFVLPFDLSPYLQAFYYNFSKTGNSADYNLKDNSLINDSESIQ